MFQNGTNCRLIESWTRFIIFAPLLELSNGLVLATPNLPTPLPTEQRA